MGGRGSGLYGGGGKRSKRSVESCRSLSIRLLQKKNLLAAAPFIWEWRDQDKELVGSIQIKPEEDGLLLSYKTYGEPRKLKIYIVETKAGYGAVKWMLCPSCGSKRAILYTIEGVFGCRDCHNLNYRSSQATDDLEYYHLQLRKLCKRLKADYQPTESFAPDRPRGMHWKTYTRIYEKYRLLARKRDEAWMRGAGAILSKYEDFM